MEEKFWDDQNTKVKQLEEAGNELLVPEQLK